MAQNNMYFYETNAGLCTTFNIVSSLFWNKLLPNLVQVIHVNKAIKRISIQVKLGSFSAVHIFWLHNNIRNFQQLSIDPCIYNAKHEENQ